MTFLFILGTLESENLIILKDFENSWIK